MCGVQRFAPHAESRLSLLAAPHLNILVHLPLHLLKVLVSLRVVVVEILPVPDEELHLLERLRRGGGERACEGGSRD